MANDAIRQMREEAIKAIASMDECILLGLVIALVSVLILWGIFRIGSNDEEEQ